MAARRSLLGIGQQSGTNETGAIVKTFEVTNVPVRCVKFIARKNWFVAAPTTSSFAPSTTTHMKGHQLWSASGLHPLPRCPSHGSYVITGSDDMTIRCGTGQDWRLVQTFEATLTTS